MFLKRFEKITAVDSYFYRNIFPWLVCSAAALFYCYEFFVRVAPSIMTRNLMQAYHINAVQIGFLLAFYYYAYTPMQLPVGILIDRYGPRRLLSMAVAACTIGSLLFASVVYYPAAALGRFLMGFGSAFAFVGVMKLAANWLPPQRFALVAGLATTLGMIGAMVGDSLSALMKLVGDWQMIWLIATAIGLVLTIVIWTCIRDEPRRKKGRLIRKEYRDWKHLFIELEHIVTNPQFWLNGLIGGMLFLPLTIFGESWGIVFLEQGYHVNQDMAGASVSMVFLGMALGGPIMGWLSDFIKKRCILLRVGAFIGTILSSILIFAPNLSILTLSLLFFFLGLSISAEVLVFAIGHEITAAKAAGTAVAGTNFLVMVGGMIFPPIVGALLDRNWEGQIVQGIHVFSLQDYRIALSLIPIALFICFVLTFLLKESYGHQVKR